MDPEDISFALGMKPRFQWMAGQRRTTPKGELLEGVNAFTYWCSEGTEGHGNDLAESLSSHLQAFEACGDFLAHFVSTSGSIEYFISWFTEGLNCGTTLDFDLLMRLAALRIELGIDVYGGPSPLGAALDETG